MPRDPDEQMALYETEATIGVQIWAWDEADAKRKLPNISVSGDDVEDWTFIETTKVTDTGRYE